MTATHLALFRGITVGKAKRVAMADLRALITGLGYLDVQTVLNSGNVLFTAPRGVRGTPAARIQEEVAVDPSRLLIAILANPADRNRLLPLAAEDWAPDILAVGSRASYLWCAGGILESRLAKRIGRTRGDAVTSRNWTTITKLNTMAGAGG